MAGPRRKKFNSSAVLRIVERQAPLERLNAYGAVTDHIQGSYALTPVLLNSNWTAAEISHIASMLDAAIESQDYELFCLARSLFLILASDLEAIDSEAMEPDE